ncbi:MAG: ABC transporter permease subunit [Candidatus Kariarchaeaceae archaeon]|jgi:simple sugar transport system permease protein
MSLRTEILGSGDRRESLLMIGISIFLSFLTVLLFVLILRIIGFEINLGELFKFAVSEILSNPKDVVKVLYWTSPLIMTGLAVAISFQAGLFNIGGQGQMVMGGAATGIFAASIAPALGWAIFDIPLIMVSLCMIIGFFGGFGWGYIPGWLKAKTGAHEVIVTIMMNFIATATVTFLVGSRSFSPFTDRSSPDAYGQTEQIMDSARIQLVFPEVSNFFNYSFFYSIIVAIILYIFVFRTNGGFKLRAVGFNPQAAKAAGIDNERVTILALALSGGVAGLGGAFYAMGTFPYRFIVGAEGTLGFDGIAVALIGQNNPLSIIGAALIFGFLAQSKGSLDINTDIPADLVFVFQGLVILYAAAPQISKSFYQIVQRPVLIIEFFQSMGRGIIKFFSGIAEGLGNIPGSGGYVRDEMKKLFSNPFAREKVEEAQLTEVTTPDLETSSFVRFSKRLWSNVVFRNLAKVYLIFELILIVLWLLNGAFEGWISPIVFHERFWDVVMETNTFKSMLIASVPIMLTAMGASFNERVGIINIGLEGIMIWGAWTAIFVTYNTGDHWAGVRMGILVGAILGFVHAFFSITMKAEQIVTGVAINLLALGMTEVLSNLFYSQNYQTVDRWVRINIYEKPVIGPILEFIRLKNYYDVPILGNFLQQIPDIIEAFNLHHPVVYLSFLLLILCHLLLFRTKYGLRMRVIGEHPQAAATAGINVKAYQYFAVILSGAMSGLGGAALVTNPAVSAYRDGVVGGRGFIALAAMIFGKWTIIGSAFASMFFGYFLTLQIRLNIGIRDFEVPNPFLQMIPFIMSILALAGFIGRARPPKHIGKPYDPTEA